MTEEYLHFIWSRKRIVASELRTQHDEPVIIRKAGFHNQLLAGPDFNHAAITISGIEWHGPVEIHVKSSDWYRHNHQNDANYNNVILHVVFEHDKEIIQNNRELPTLELKPYIDWEHFEKYFQFHTNQQEITCAATLSDTDPIFLNNMMSKALITKWNEKAKVLSEYIDDQEDAMFCFLGAAFGGHLNMHPFLQTIATVPRKRLKSLTPMKRYNLLMSQSGMLHGRTKNSDRWHFKGNRPGNFPTKRMYQFAFYMHDDQLKLLAELASPEDVLNQFDEIMRPQSPQLKLTASFKNHIVINAVAPYFNYCANLHQDNNYQQFAIDLLKLLPPENNTITRKWRAIGRSPKNAWESQGFLSLYRYHCSAKKCLSCEVGNAIITGVK